MKEGNEVGISGCHFPNGGGEGEDPDSVAALADARRRARGGGGAARIGGFDDTGAGSIERLLGEGCEVGGGGCCASSGCGGWGGGEGGCVDLDVAVPSANRGELVQNAAAENAGALHPRRGLSVVVPPSANEATVR